MRYVNNEKGKTHIPEKKNQSTETVCENNQMSDLTQKDFKIAVMNIFKELRKTFKTV